MVLYFFLYTKNKAHSCDGGGGVAGRVLGMFTVWLDRSQPWRDKMNLTGNVKITDNHKSRKRALRVDDES